MTTAQQLLGLRARADDSTTVKDFRDYCLALAKGGKEQDTRNPRVQEVLKAASPAWGSSSMTSPYALAIQRLIGTNSPRSAFNLMKRDMIQVPLRTRVMVMGGTIDASEVAEGGAKLFRRISLSDLDTETSKHASTVAITKEFADMAPELAGRVLADTLAEAVSRSADTYFLSKLVAASSGEGDTDADPTFAEMLKDLSELLRMVKTGQSSKLYFIFRPQALKYLASMAYGAGVSTVKYDGGEIMGVQCIASDSQASGTITLADASGIVFGDEGIEVRTSTQAAVELDDASTKASATSVQGTTLVACWQTNTMAVVAEQRIAVRVAARSSVASLTGVNWGIGDGSPANF
jgi:HK97 family phage major capsid protein